MEIVEGYNEILRDIRSLLEKATYQAYKAVDNLRVQTYWQIGERISRGELEHKDKPEYGGELLKRLAKDINLAWRNTYNALLFYKKYPILQTVSAKLSWSHYVELITLQDVNLSIQQGEYSGCSIRWCRQKDAEKIYRTIMETDYVEQIRNKTSIPSTLCQHSV